MGIVISVGDTNAAQLRMPLHCVIELFSRFRELGGP
jgi:hypothetical protein